MSTSVKAQFFMNSINGNITGSSSLHCKYISARQIEITFGQRFGLSSRFPSNGAGEILNNDFRGALKLFALASLIVFFLHLFVDVSDSESTAADAHAPMVNTLEKRFSQQFSRQLTRGRRPPKKKACKGGTFHPLSQPNHPLLSLGKHAIFHFFDRCTC